jgi:hypothetical protein
MGKNIFRLIVSLTRLKQHHRQTSLFAKKPNERTIVVHRVSSLDNVLNLLKRLVLLLILFREAIHELIIL